MAARLLSGSVVPNGNVFGDPGDLYQNTSGGAGTTFWIKESGVGTDTGWTPLAATPSSTQQFIYTAGGGEGSDFRVTLPTPQPTPYLVFAQAEGTANSFIIDIPFADQTTTDFRVLTRGGTPSRNDEFAFEVVPPTAPIPP